MSGKPISPPGANEPEPPAMAPARAAAAVAVRAVAAAARAAALAFFVVHAATTALVGAQVLLPARWFPAFARAALAGYLKDFRDPVMSPPHAPWFRAAIAGELLLQLPFFLFAAAAFARRRNAVRLPAVAYAGYALASALPYVAELAAHRAWRYDPRPLLRMNAPWVAAPALLAAAMAARPRPFGPAGGSPEPCAPAAWAAHGTKTRTALDRLFLAFFLSHIPITLLIDAQAVLPPARFPAAARAASAWYLRTYNDPLMAPPIAPWFAALCWSELLLQLPFFFAAAYAFARRRAWVRLPAVFYGSFVLGTMAPILAELAAHRARGYRRAAVLAMYAPYAAVPALLVATMAAAGPAPFGPARAGGARAKRA